MAERKPHPTHLLRYDWESSVIHRTTSQQKKAGLASYKREVKAATELDLGRDLVDSGKYDHGGIYAKTPYFTFMDYIGSNIHKKYIDNPLGQRDADKRAGLKRQADAKRKSLIAPQATRAVLKYRCSPKTPTKVKSFIAHLVSVANAESTSKPHYDLLVSFFDTHYIGVDFETINTPRGKARAVEAVSQLIIERTVDMINASAVVKQRGLHAYGLSKFHTGLVRYLSHMMGGKVNTKYHSRYNGIREESIDSVEPDSMWNTHSALEELFEGFDVDLDLSPLASYILAALVSSGELLVKNETIGIDAWAFRNHPKLWGAKPNEIRQVKFSSKRVKYIAASGLSFDTYKEPSYKPTEQRLWDFRLHKNEVVRFFNDGKSGDDKLFRYTLKVPYTVTDVNTFTSLAACEAARDQSIIDKRNARRRNRRRIKAIEAERKAV